MIKQNKIIVAVHTDVAIRKQILKRIIVDKGFAVTQSDALKLLRASVYDLNLAKAYFVIADNYVFRESPLTLQRLYELAARGIAVILGTSKLPREYEFICEAYFE